MKEELTESLEKYLLAIYEIVQKNQAARVKDVANYLHIGGPATSDAVRTLAERKFINYVPYGIITITEKGRKRAEEKIYRYRTISDFLEKVLMIKAEKIEESAKNIEYCMSEDVLEKFVMFLNFMERCSCKEPKWMSSYKFYAKNSSMREQCRKCMEQEDSEGCICSCKGCQ